MCHNNSAAALFIKKKVVICCPLVQKDKNDSDEHKYMQLPKQNSYSTNRNSHY